MILPFTDRSTANGSYPPFAQRWEARRPFAIGCITLFSLLFTSHINPEPGKSIQGEPAPARNKATSEIVVSAASSLT
ncbi:MAG: hypothetical protein KDK33_19675, partial [Leptospiraceae bacterium]|nr:hypothetical protein [Leptospiraceae bacterium]